MTLTKGDNSLVISFVVFLIQSSGFSVSFRFPTSVYLFASIRCSLPRWKADIDIISPPHHEDDEPNLKRCHTRTYSNTTRLTRLHMLIHA